jgi:hypothetical protein
MADHLRDATKKMDFIRREAASDKLYKLPCKIDEDGYRWVLSRDVTHMIDEIPAADVWPVVRCVDCLYDHACLTQQFVKEASRIPFDSNVFFCPDGIRRPGNG